MKRSFILVLSFILAFMAFAQPVAAAESSIHYVDLLSGGYITYKGTNYDNMRVAVSGSDVVYFPITVSYALGKCEFLIYTNSRDVKLFGGSGYNIELTKSSCPLGSQYYVFTGDLGGIGPRVYLSAPNGCYVYFMAAKAMPVGYSNTACKFDVELLYHADDSYTANYVDQTTFSFSPYADNTVHSFRIAPKPSSIAGMDYIDLDLYIFNMRINSISASVGGVALDVARTEDILYPEGGDESYLKVNLRINISGISMVDGQCIIFVETQSNDGSGGSGNVDPNEGFFHIFSIKSGLYFYTPNPELSVLNKIWNAITSGFSSVGSWIADHTTSIVNMFQDLKMNLGLWFQNLEYTIKDAFHFESNSDDLTNKSEDNQNNMGEISRFEDQYIGDFDNYFGDASGSVNYGSFLYAFKFLQQCLELSIDGLGEGVVVITVPLFLGIFFYICSRVPGLTHWKGIVPKEGRK